MNAAQHTTYSTCPRVLRAIDAMELVPMQASAGWGYPAPAPVPRSRFIPLPPAAEPFEDTPAGPAVRDESDHPPVAYRMFFGHKLRTV